jgi:N-acyl-D-aspartate/D-glutamate deacylase
MAHDMIIRGGTVIDGTGSAGRAADVAVDGDRITAVGDLSAETARAEVDATGLTVTPGFVDLHTHLDAQIGWDPLMTSSSWQGVTTALIGNCGVSFAPVTPQNRAYLAELMESVEDIPRGAILDGLPWDWHTYPEYLDSVQRMNPALNVVGLVGHCAVRYHAMGDRSMDEGAVATPDELALMRDIMAEAVAGGAVGFSTSRILLHTVPDGRKVPGTFAPVEEYVAMAEGMNRSGGGLFQAVMDFATKMDHEMDLLRTMAETAGDVLFSTGVGNGTGQGPVDFWGGHIDDMRRNHGRVTGVSQIRPSGTLMGLQQVPPVAGPRWKAVMKLPTLTMRLAALKDPATREGLVEEGKARGLWYDASLVHPLGDGDVPDYHMEGGKSVADLAAELGVSPVEVVIDRLIRSEGRELFNVWFFSRNMDAMPNFLNLDGVIPGLGDAGAHAGQICDADATTHYLSYWVRDRGTTTLENAVHKITQKSASVLGLVDRGTLAPGMHADINIFDAAGLDIAYPEYVNDFPHGSGRFRVNARGYAATIVNGRTVTENGRNTGERSGRVLREFSRG